MPARTNTQSRNAALAGHACPADRSRSRTGGDGASAARCGRHDGGQVLYRLRRQLRLKHRDPINTATGAAGRPIPVGEGPLAIAITPNGKTAYVVNTLGHTVTPITIATNTAGPTIPASLDPSVIAITPNSKTAYVLNLDSVIPIATATNTAGRPVNVGAGPSRSRSPATGRPRTSPPFPAQ